MNVLLSICAGGAALVVFAAFVIFVACVAGGMADAQAGRK